MREGLSSVTEQPGLSLMTFLVFLFNLARGFELVLLVLVAQDLLGLGSEGVGLLNAAIGVGALLTVPLVSRIASLHRPAGAVASALLLTSIPLAMLASITDAVGRVRGVVRRGHRHRRVRGAVDHARATPEPPATARPRLRDPELRDQRRQAHRVICSRRSW